MVDRQDTSSVLSSCPRGDTSLTSCLCPLLLISRALRSSLSPPIVISPFLLSPPFHDHQSCPPHFLSSPPSPHLTASFPHSDQIQRQSLEVLTQPLMLPVQFLQNIPSLHQLLSGLVSFLLLSPSSMVRVSTCSSATAEVTIRTGCSSLNLPRWCLEILILNPRLFLPATPSRSR